MDSQKLLAVAALLFIMKDYSVHGQCTGSVEFINQPSAMPTITTTSYVQPISQFVIPAVIKPLIQTEPYMPAIPPRVPDYSSFYNSICPGTAMPPIIFDSGDRGSELDNLLYFLLFALKNRRNGNNRRCYCENSCRCGSLCNCSNCNNCGCCGKCHGCNSCNGCRHCGNCGNSGGSGKSCGCESCGGCGTGYNNSDYGSIHGNNGNNSCACGGNCIFIPYPIAVPFGNAIQCGSGGGCSIPVIDTAFGGCDDCQSSTSNCQNPNEINLIIRTDG